MQLTKEEEKILSGEDGFAKQKAMQILVALGKTYDADKLIPIKSAHIAGVSYKSLGDAGLEFLQELANEFPQVAVKTTLNPSGVSPKMNPPKDFVKKQNQIIDAYRALGIEITLTCTPFYVGNTPKKGDHISWSESSAVVYANSLLGAYTNREGGPSALASALIGKTPNYGLHLDKNRKAELNVKVVDKLLGFHDFAALGYYIGSEFKDKIASFDFLTRPSDDNLKGLCAAIAAAGSVPMFKLGTEGKEKVEITYKELETVFEKFNSNLDPDLICIGCPHASIREIEYIASLLKGKIINQNIQFWVFTSKFLENEIKNKGFYETIEDAGAKIITDTCMVVAPLEELGYKCMLTNSAKAAHYARSLCNIETKLDNLKNIINYSTK